MNRVLKNNVFLLALVFVLQGCAGLDQRTGLYTLGGAALGTAAEYVFTGKVTGRGPVGGAAVGFGADQYTKYQNQEAQQEYYRRQGYGAYTECSQNMGRKEYNTRSGGWGGNTNCRSYSKTPGWSQLPR